MVCEEGAGSVEELVGVAAQVARSPAEVAADVAELRGDGGVDELVADAELEAADHGLVGVGVEDGFLAQRLAEAGLEGLEVAFLGGGRREDVDLDATEMLLDELVKGAHDGAEVAEAPLVVENLEEADDVIESFEKLDKDKRAKRDLGKGNRGS